MSVSVFIAGDVAPGKTTSTLFNEKNVKMLFGEIIPYIICDINIVNLEAPIVRDGVLRPIEKSGPTLMSTKETLETIKLAGFDLITLANNHFRDHGQVGVDDTITSAHELNMKYVGAGRNLHEARSIFYQKIKDNIIAVINVCEHEFSIASTHLGGSNPIDLINMQQDITEARNKADYVIVITHGGVEHYQYPTPRMKRLYRHFVNLGADAVINHHQHCINGYEIYNNKPIFYGLGNLQFEAFAKCQNTTKWHNGYAVVLKLGETIEFELIPYIQNLIDSTIILRSKEDFEREMSQLNLIIQDDALLDKQFKDYTKEILLNTQITFFPSFISKRCINTLARRGLLGQLYNHKQRLKILNQLCCKDKSEFDVEIAKKKLSKGWGGNYSKYNKEYPYKDLKPRIIAEQYMEDESGYELKDYKIFCFNGEPKVLFVATDRQKKGEETKFDFFDLEWNHLPVTNGHPNNSNPIARPQNFDEMLDVARQLSKGIPQVRIDLYNCNGKIYFGEITFFHNSGMTPFNPVEWDYKFGEMIKLPIVK